MSLPILRRARPVLMLSILTTLLVLVEQAAAITGAWYFTGYRFEGRVSSPQVTRSDGTVSITKASSGSYTLAFQFSGSSASVTAPLVQTGNDYRAEFELSASPYDIIRSVVVRDHGNNILTVNWVDAGYEQVSPYFGEPDMQKLSAVSGALTKTVAPASDANAWQGLYHYDGHVFEADDTHDTLHENFSEEYQATRAGTSSFVITDLEDGEQMTLEHVGGELRWQGSSSAVTTNYEDAQFLVESYSELEHLRVIQLGAGRAVFVWFAQTLHRLKIKSPPSGPYPSIQYANAEVGLLTTLTTPTGPPTSATADSDGDGVPDLVEYAFNLNPALRDRKILTEASGTAGLPSIRRSSPSSGPLRVEYLRRKNATTLGIAYAVQWSSDLAAWTAGGTTVAVTSIDADWERVVVTDPSTGPKRFARVVVTRLANP